MVRDALRKVPEMRKYDALAGDGAGVVGYGQAVPEKIDTVISICDNGAEVIWGCKCDSEQDRAASANVVFLARRNRRSADAFIIEAG